MTREEYHAQKALREKRRATERKSYEASKGSMDLSFLLLTLLLTGIGLVMLFLPWFFKGNGWMPGDALQEIRERYIVKLNPEFCVAGERDDLADAAAWEFDRRDIPAVNKKYAGEKLPVYVIRFSGSVQNPVALFTKDGIELLSWNTSPEAQLLKDLTR